MNLRGGWRGKRKRQVRILHVYGFLVHEILHVRVHGTARFRMATNQNMNNRLFVHVLVAVLFVVGFFFAFLLFTFSVVKHVRIAQHLFVHVGVVVLDFQRPLRVGIKRRPVELH